MKRVTWWLLPLLAMGAAAYAGGAPRTANGHLIDDHGHTLYTYDRDTEPGHSSCAGPCAAVWPPYLAGAGAERSGKLSMAMDAGGRVQWALEGHPLYTYAGDDQPGDAKGDGMNGTWHIAH